MEIVRVESIVMKGGKLRKSQILSIDNRGRAQIPESERQNVSFSQKQLLIDSIG